MQDSVMEFGASFEKCNQTHSAHARRRVRARLTVNRSLFSSSTESPSSKLIIGA